jgi:hypothetical protein
MSPQNFGRPRWRSLVALEADHAMLGVENHSTALALYFAGRHRYRYHSDMPGQHWERAANEDQGTKARHSAVLCEFDTITALESWVEHGAAPDGIIATKYDGDVIGSTVLRTMPLCKYPEQAHYIGTGDQTKAPNWSCSPLDRSLLDVGLNGIQAGLLGHPDREASGDDSH